jgi:hypothetical protein
LVIGLGKEVDTSGESRMCCNVEDLLPSVPDLSAVS